MPSGTLGQPGFTDEPATLSGWNEFVQSRAALRLASAKARWDIAIPVLSVDPLRQWLLEEAIMARYELEQAAAEKAQAEEDEAMDKARRFSKGEDVT